MTPARIETLVWVLIYAGMLGVTLGWFVQPRSAVLGGTLMAIGAAMMVAGAVLVVVRSRMKG